LTGKKHEQKIYKHHSGFIGGLKEVPISRMRERRPEEVCHLSQQFSQQNRDVGKGADADGRLSEELFLACYLKTHFDRDVLID